MIEHLAPQGSDEWKAARAGCITASNFKMIRSKVGGLTEQQTLYVNALKAGNTEAKAQEIAGYKKAPTASAVQMALEGKSVGEWSDAAKNYAFRLAIERISGLPLDEGFETWSMQRGHELEPMARMCHEELTGDFVRQVGFVSTDDGKFGASADGFRSNIVGCEYKCFVSPEKLRAILLDEDLSDVMDQMQGGMWLTGANVWEFGLYCPALESIGRHFTMVVVHRDDDYIEEMEVDLVAFERLVTEYEDKLRAKAGPGDIFAPPPAPGEPTPASIAGLITPPATPKVAEPQF